MRESQAHWPRPGSVMPWLQLTNRGVFLPSNQSVLGNLGPLVTFPTLHYAVSPVARTASSWPSAQTVELASPMSVDLMSAVTLPKWTQGLP